MIAGTEGPPTYRPPTEPRALVRIRDEWRPRRAGLVFHTRRIECADGHNVQLHGRMILGNLHCMHRERAGAPPCGLYVLVMVIPRGTALGEEIARGGVAGRRYYYAADVTLEEIEELEQDHLDAEAVVARFGGIFPPGRRRR